MLVAVHSVVVWLPRSSMYGLRGPNRHDAGAAESQAHEMVQRRRAAAAR